MSKKTTKQDYRLRVTTELKHHTYIVRKGDRVSYISSDETPLALSNLIFQGAAEVRFALEDDTDGFVAARNLRTVLQALYKQAPDKAPKVEVLS